MTDFRETGFDETTQAMDRFGRRDFFRLTTAGLAAGVPFASAAAPGAPVKFGLIGCGGRGVASVAAALSRIIRESWSTPGSHVEEIVPDFARSDAETFRCGRGGSVSHRPGSVDQCRASRARTHLPGTPGLGRGLDAVPGDY